jgi:hypothetical protein
MEAGPACVDCDCGETEAENSEPARTKIVTNLKARDFENPFDFGKSILYLNRMKTEISFCPTCAGKLDVADDDQFQCEDCETKFYIQIADEGDGDDDDDEDDDEEEEEEEEKEEEY